MLKVLGHILAHIHIYSSQECLMTLCMQAHVWTIFRIRSLTHLEVTFINFFPHLYFQAVGSSTVLSAALMELRGHWNL